MTGYLPYWLYFTAALSASSTVQCYMTSRALPLTRMLYQHAPQAEVTQLTARLFGTWNLLSTAARVIAARHVHEPGAFDLGLLTFAVALAHFAWEWQVARTVGGRSLLAAEVTPAVSVVWMLVQREFYLQKA